MARWDAEHPELRYLRTLTRVAGPPPIGRIPAILADLLPRLERHRVYIAGDSGFVVACADAARRHGAAPERVFSEGFFVERSRGVQQESNRMDANGTQLHQDRDDGTTGLLHGGRVCKSDPLFDVYGSGR